jgi:hypothetical protein
LSVDINYIKVKPWWNRQPITACLR